MDILTMAEKPKRPMSAYLLWLNSARDQIKSDNPGLKFTDIAKKGGEMWRAMEDKSEWEEKAAEAKEQYTKDLESFNANGDVATVVTKKAQKRGKKPPTKAPAKAPAAPKSKKIKEESEDEDEEDEDSE